ncbi:MAG: galactose mutarotase [Clostridia bacterium]|nr:galactose mutarotase [Clostridia bacterium]
MIKTYILKNKNQLSVTVLNLGGIIHEIQVPDRNGKFKNIIFGFDTLEAYENNNAYFGAIIGRVAGRIHKGEFQINERAYQSSTRDRGNTLHGGQKGFDKKIWQVKENKNQLVLSCQSEDLEEGFPGKLDVKVTYTLTDENALILDYEATTSEDTYVNLTNHSYFNLSEEPQILNHQLLINSDEILELDETSIPTGKLLSVKNTPFDFNMPKKIGQDIGDTHPQILQGNGYDHPWRLKKDNHLKASLYDPKSGRKMSMYSDQNALILYSYNFPLKGDEKHMGLAIEFQNDPDSMHHDHFNSCLLKKGETYRQRTIYEFTVE